MWAWKVGPALAAGCTIVMKPSELTPLTALALCDLVVEAGFPPGGELFFNHILFRFFLILTILNHLLVINVLGGLGATTGNAIASHMDINKIAFTGSVITGRRVMTAAAQSNLKKVTLELGGKSPALIFPSADLDSAAAWIAMGIYFNSGQDCCASSRLFVHEVSS